jgi:hypothetical protein
LIQRVAHGSAQREVVYNIFIEFHIPKYLIKTIKISLNEADNKTSTSKFLPATFPIHNGLKQGGTSEALL